MKGNWLFKAPVPKIDEKDAEIQKLKAQLADMEAKKVKFLLDAKQLEEDEK